MNLYYFITILSFTFPDDPTLREIEQINFDHAWVTVASCCCYQKQIYFSGPAFIEQPTSEESFAPVYGDPDKGLTMTCIASGHQRKITWTKGGGSIPEGLFKRPVEEKVTNGPYEYDQEEALKSQLEWTTETNPTCNNVANHSGKYECEAETVIRQGYTRTASESFTVNVTCKHCSFSIPVNSVK